MPEPVVEAIAGAEKSPVVKVDTEADFIARRLKKPEKEPAKAPEPTKEPKEKVEGPGHEADPKAEPKAVEPKKVELKPQRQPD